MPDEPISNPPTPRTPTTPPVSRESPGVGFNEEAQEPKPFSLPPQPLPQRPAGPETAGKPTPMEAIREGTEQKSSPEQVQQVGHGLVDKIQQTKTLYSDKTKTQGLSQEHFDAMTKIVDRLGSDMQKVSKYTEQKPPIVQKKKNESVLDYVVDYLETSQGTAQNAIEYLAKAKNPNMAQLLSVQYAMQRASQKVELLASVIGSTVSGLKTLMATQLG